MPTRIVTLHRWQIALAFTAVTAAFVVGLMLVVHFNDQRVSDIQQSRIESCKRTYEGIRDVFRPFFPPPEHRTAKQRADLAKFNRTIERLKAGCTRQISTKGTP